MPNVRQHVPNFVSGVKPGHAEARTLAELRAVEFVASWESEPEFSHWAATDRLLVAHMKDGKYWVAAYLDEPKLYGLPHD